MSDEDLKPLLIAGAGGHGREVLWLVKNINKVQPKYKVLGFIDDDVIKGTQFSGFSVLGTAEDLSKELSSNPYFAIGVGKNDIWKELALRFEALGWKPVTLIDPSAVVAEDVEIGVGCYVGKCFSQRSYWVACNRS